MSGATCPKFNLVGPEEIDNLQLAKMIAAEVGKELNYTMVDFHSSRPGHDLRYAISGIHLRSFVGETDDLLVGSLLKSLGWEPKVKLSARLKEFTRWMLDNPRWLDVAGDSLAPVDPTPSQTATCIL